MGQPQSPKFWTLKPCCTTLHRYLPYPQLSEQSVQWSLRTRLDKICEERKRSSRRRNIYIFFLLFLYWEKQVNGIGGKKVAIFNREWGRNSAPREGTIISWVMHHTFMHAHTAAHNLWLRPKRPPLVFSVSEMSVAEMSGPKCPGLKCPRPKCPTFILVYIYTVKLSTIVPTKSDSEIGFHFQLLSKTLTCTRHLSQCETMDQPCINPILWTRSIHKWSSLITLQTTQEATAPPGWQDSI